MASSVYIETTIPSYLTAWRSPELSMAAKQQTTRQWWDERRQNFELFISDAVLLEASGGDSVAAKRRLEVLDGIPVLSPQPKVDEIALPLVDRLNLPDRALTGAAHISIFVLLINLWVTAMTFDPILSEIRRIREEYAQQFNGNLRAMMDDLRRRHAESDRTSVTRQPKPISVTSNENSA